MGEQDLGAQILTCEDLEDFVEGRANPCRRAEIDKVEPDIFIECFDDLVDESLDHEWTSALRTVQDQEVGGVMFPCLGVIKRCCVLATLIVLPCFSPCQPPCTFSISFLRLPCLPTALPYCFGDCITLTIIDVMVTCLG